MVDAATLDFIETIVIVGAFVGAIVGLILQKRVSKDDAYHALRKDHQEIVRLIISNDKLLNVYETVEGRRYEKAEKIELKKDEQLLVNFFILEFDLYERLYYAKEKKNLFKDEEWDMWLDWLMNYNKNWLFRYTLDRYGMVWEKGCVDAIYNKIEEDKKLKKSN